jgi:hypothetical protein
MNLLLDELFKKVERVSANCISPFHFPFVFTLSCDTSRDLYTSMSNSFNGVRLRSEHDDDDTEDRLDDHEDDGSKEHTRLLQQETSSSSSGNHKARDTDRASNRRNGNRSMVHSLYTSPKHSVSQRRQASFPGSPIHGACLQKSIHELQVLHTFEHPHIHIPLHYSYLFSVN